MRYGYDCDILEDLEMTYMSEYEFMEAVMEELERKPALTHDEYVRGIQAITFAERKALIRDLIENWESICNCKESSNDTLDWIVTKHGIYDMGEFELIVETIDKLFSI